MSDDTAQGKNGNGTNAENEEFFSPSKDQEKTDESQTESIAPENDNKDSSESQNPKPMPNNDPEKSESIDQHPGRKDLESIIPKPDPKDDKSDSKVKVEKVHIPSPLDPLPSQKEKSRRLSSGLFSTIIVMFLFLFFVTLATGTAAALIVYDIVPFQNRDIKNKLTGVLMKIPFLPRTKGYVLKTMIDKQSTVKSAYVDASVAVSSSGLQNYPGFEELGITEFDMSLKGPFNFKDESNSKLSFKLNVTNQFDMDLMVLDNNLFFKINTIPTFIKSLLGAMADSSLNSLLDVWVRRDISPFESEARDTLDEFKSEQDTPENPEAEALSAILADEILPKLDMKEESLDGFDTYKVGMKMEKAEIKKFMGSVKEKMQKAYEEMTDEQRRSALFYNDSMESYVNDGDSDYIEDIVFNVWVDKNDYYLRKLALIMRIDGEALSSTPYIGDSMVLGDTTTSEPIDFTLVVKFSDHGNDFEFIAPTDFMEMDEYATEVLKLMGFGQYFDPESQESHNTFLMNHHWLKTQVLTYWVNNNQPPGSIDLLADSYPNGIKPQYVDFVTSPDYDVVLVFGIDPMPPEYSSPLLITVIDNTEEISEDYYSIQDASILLSQYGINVDLTDFINDNIPPVIGEPEPPLSTPIPTIPEEPTPGTPFGKYLN